MNKTIQIQNLLVRIKEECPNGIQLLAKLNDGRAFTAIELSKATKIDKREVLKYLQLFSNNNIIKLRENSNRSYYFIDNQLAITIIQSWNSPSKKITPKGLEYCRHCYRHLAGFVGVKLTNFLQENGYLIPYKKEYEVSIRGWVWFSQLGITPADFKGKDSFTKQCLDFSERKSHVGGKLGDRLLEKLLELKWLAQVPNSREIIITDLGYNSFVFKDFKEDSKEI